MRGLGAKTVGAGLGGTSCCFRFGLLEFEIETESWGSVSTGAGKSGFSGARLSRSCWNPCRRFWVKGGRGRVPGAGPSPQSSSLSILVDSAGLAGTDAGRRLGNRGHTYRRSEALGVQGSVTTPEPRHTPPASPSSVPRWRPGEADTQASPGGTAGQKAASVPKRKPTSS